MGRFSEVQGGGFGFGIEAEFLLLDQVSKKPLFYRDLSFEKLLDILDQIPVSDINCERYDIKPLHRRAIPYLVEGYYLTDEDMKPHTLLAKGVELRTPVVTSIEQTVSDLEELYQRLQTSMSGAGFSTAILSHHPTESQFDAPPNYKRHDYWQWALTAMTTAGPDINISLPAQLSAEIDLAQLHDKINYYMPSLVALSLASPLLDGDLWQIRGQIGKSIRTYRRSLWAPLYYIHTKPALRFEFKGFEMAHCLQDYQAFFLLCLALLLGPGLDGRASDATRTYDLGNIAVSGLELPFVRERAAIVLQAAEKLALNYNIDRTALDAFWHRLDRRHVPADDIIEIYSRTKSIPTTMGQLTNFTQGITIGQYSVPQLCIK